MHKKITFTHYTHIDTTSGTTYLTKVPAHATTYNTTTYPPTNSDMVVFYDAQGRIAGGGQLIVEEKVCFCTETE